MFSNLFSTVLFQINSSHYSYYYYYLFFIFIFFFQQNEIAKITNTVTKSCYKCCQTKSVFYQSVIEWRQVDN